MNILAVTKSLLSGIVQKIEDNKSDILFHAGMLMEFGAIAYTAAASYSAVKICEEGKKEEAKVYLTEPDEKAIVTKRLKIKSNTGLKLAKTYLPAGIMYGISVYCHLESRDILKKENRELGAKLLTYGAIIEGYRSRVREKDGSEAEEQLYYGYHKEKIDMTEVQEDGTEKTVKKSVNVLPDNFNSKEYDNLEGYQKWFSPETSDKYILSSRIGLHNANTELFKSCESFSTMKLISNASDGENFLSLDYPFEYLGLDKTKYSYNAGWTYDKENPRGDNYVKIAYKEFYKAHRYFDDISQQMETRYIPVYLLEFNVDGKISDCPGRKEK